MQCMHLYLKTLALFVFPLTHALTRFNGHTHYRLSWIVWSTKSQHMRMIPTKDTNKHAMFLLKAYVQQPLHGFLRIICQKKKQIAERISMRCYSSASQGE